MSDAARYDPDNTLIVAGDFNLDASKHRAGVSPLRAGFHDGLPAERTPTTPLRRLLEAGRHIDWVFVRGQIQTGDGQVHKSVKASDHYPISFNLRRAR